MILAINCLQLIGTAEILSGKIRENMDLAINCLAIIEVKQSRKRRSLSQMIDQVMTINSVQKSSKSELSSWGKRPFKVLLIRPVNHQSGWPVDRDPLTTSKNFNFH